LDGSLKKVLVSGASGFIGRHLCAALQRSGVQVLGLGRKDVKEGPWEGFVCADVAQAVPGDALSGVDTVFHLAGKAHALSESEQDEADYFRINTEGTRKLLEAAASSGVRRFVFFSSIKAMGESSQSDSDEQTACAPQTPYGKSKREAELLVLEGGFVPEPVVLRPAMVYGPENKGNLSQMIDAIAHGRFPPLPEFGNKRSMVHVDDLVAAAILVAERKESIGQIYIVSDGEPCSTRQIYEWICEALGKDLPHWCVPESILKLLAKAGDVIGRIRGRRFIFDSDALDKLSSSACYSSERIHRELGFEAQHHLRTSLLEIIRVHGA